MAEDGAAPVEKKTEPRDYMVLGKRGDGLWMELGATRALTDKKAIAPHAVKNGKLLSQLETEGEVMGEIMGAFVAVPLRSWNVRTPKVKADPQLSWS